MKIILIILLSLLALLLAYILLVIVSAYVYPCRYSDHNSRYFRWLLVSSMFLVCLVARIRVKVTGMEKIPKNTRFLMVGNHISKFDPMLGFYIFKDYDIAYISKPENFNIFSYGRIIRECCFMPINRENPAEAAKTLKRAENLIKADEVSIGVYPEGKRGDGSALLPFHNGMFHIAKSTGVPIVVVGSRGTREISRNFPLHGTKVNIDILDVIDADYIREHRTSEIGERIAASLTKLYPIGSEPSDK